MANERHPSCRTFDYAQLLSESFHLEGYPTNSMKVQSSDRDANESSPLDERSPNSISSISRSNLGHFVSEDDQLEKTEAHVGTHDPPKDVQISATSRHKSCPGQIIRLGWWGEIGSILLGVICAVFIFAILVTMDGKPMSKWHLPIQPNSLIAVFSTLAKYWLLYPIAECIGQLKWTYFERPRPLDRMEVFDGATRGPWGSLIFLWKTKATMLLASLGALITVILLTFEPFAQQAVGFSTHLAPLNNITGSVTKTNAWSDIHFQYNESPLTDYIQFQLSLAFLQALADQPMSGFSNAYCPTKKCTVPNFVSLAVCATCTEESISEGYFDTCNYGVSYGEYGSNNFTNFTNAQNMREYLRENPEYSEVYANYTKDFPDFPQFTIVLNIRDGTSALRHTESGEDEQESTSDGGTSAMNYRDRYLQSCNAPRHLTDSQSTKIVGQTCFNSTTKLFLYNNTDHIAQINGTVSKCRLDFCVKKYEDVIIDRDEMMSQITTDTQLELQNRSAPGNDNDDVWHSKQSQGFGSIDFRVGQSNRHLLNIMVEDMFDNWMIRRALYYQKIPRTASFGNWTSRFHHLADIMSLIIQAPPNPNATNMTGQVYADEIFVHVHWGWIIMPISIVIISSIFLLLTIVKSRKKPYLFKTSILATLFHGLEERNISEFPALTKTNRVVSKDLVKKSEAIVVKLKRNNEDILKLLEG